MKRGRIIFFGALLLVVAAEARAGWQKQNSGSLAWLYSVWFENAENGWAAGSNGTLLRTKNSGKRWTRVPLKISDTVRDVYFTDRLSGWLLCDRGRAVASERQNPSYLMHTADGGERWTAIELRDSPERFSRMFFGGSGRGYLIGEGGILVRISTSGGAESRTAVRTKFLTADGWVAAKGKIILVGGGGTVLMSGDFGQNWQAAKFDGERPTVKLNSIFFANAATGWAVGNRGEIFSTRDGGARWRAQTAGTNSALTDVAFVNAESGFAVGENGIILRTADGGEHWLADESGVRHRLESVAVAGSKIFAVGFGGTILATEFAGRDEPGRGN